MSTNSIHMFNRFNFTFCVVFAFSVIFSADALRGEGLQTVYQHYTAPDETNYFAVGFQSPEVPAKGPSEVVFLVDTSASQMGQARLDTLAAVVSAVNNLPEGTSIQIFAMDADTDPLTPNFVAKGSPELEAALRKLHRRVPLGATDFGNGVETVRKAFAGRDVNTRRAVLYLGDGRSMAKTVDVPQFEQEVKNFNVERIPFTACAVGLQTNFGLIAAFANRTGGNLIDVNAVVQAGTQKVADQAAQTKAESVDLPDFGNEVGKQLADSATATVLWIDPASQTFPEKSEVYPKAIQPIRSDRATIIVGKTDAETLPVFEMTLTGSTTPDNVVEVSFKAVPNKKPGASAGNNYLKAVVETAAKDEGLTMPIVGWDSLAQLQEGFLNNVDDLLSKADAAITTGNPDRALVLLNNVLTVDPNNKIAQQLSEQAEQVHQNGLAGADAAKAAGVNPLPEYVDAVTTEHSAVVQKIQNDVRQVIISASKTAETDPDAAMQELKLMQQSIRNIQMAPSERLVLLDRLGNTIKQVEHAKFVAEFKSVQNAQNEASMRARQETLHSMQDARIKAVPIFDRFAALMDAKEYKAATLVADESVQKLPDHPAPYVARRMSQMISYIEEYEQLRHQRHVGFIDSFMETERSFIPVPDEPPITYIDRERWLLLSDYRKKKYSVTNLSDPDEATKKIEDVLARRDIRLDIDENTTFADLFKMINDQLGTQKIQIDLDRKALAEAGEIQSDTPIAPDGFDHPGIKLRNALRLLLSPHDLTYCIKDEVLLITTVEEAQKNMSIKVYPMADLIISPEPSGGGMGGGMMGGMGGGMMGGMGGGMMGGMGGGMMGGMGGMGGGMMGGMGGGMGGYSVPDEIQRGVPTDSPAASVPEQARKLLNNAQSASDPEKFWENYFAAGNVNGAVVHEVVRRLEKEMKNKKPVAGQVVALVESAIMNGAAQPWMYEALTWSLYLNGAPRKEILRAALSAADFCENPIDLLNVGFVMRSTALNMKKEAFPLYKQALEVMVPKREFYSATLRLAEELYTEQNDEESLRWICLAVLTQEWDGVMGSKMVNDASDLLVLVGNKMLKDGRKKEADALAASIQEAKLRDCVVTVEWTGDAGLDLMVREPTDSYCWFKSPRTASGGLLKLNPVTDLKQAEELASGKANVKRLSYVCPKGYSGTYSLVLQKMWGDLPNNLVKIAVQTNVIPGEKQREGTAVAMDPNGVIINFDLDKGRRTESVAEGELTVAELQMSVAQQVVARNTALWRLADEGVLAADNDSSNSDSSSSSSNNNNSTTDSNLMTGLLADMLYNRGQVGYGASPTLYPVGASLYVGNLVVSPDRRYVRLSPSPMFSQISQVLTYNNVSGATNDISSNYGSGGGMSGGMGGGMGGMMGGGMSGMGGMGGGMGMGGY
ncbi:hypothetical protein FACS1894189_1800 [Planctomycetales bacterium]|nr:hypothetical protein FACS1894189_1800 [Planctomycetales bacterium]